MPFVTTLILQSGDRDVLERIAVDIKERAERKGVELRGPHAESPTGYGVPQAKRLADDDRRFPAWKYTVYTRTMEVIGHDDFAREIAGRELPRGVHLGIEVERVSAPGSD